MLESVQIMRVFFVSLVLEAFRLFLKAAKCAVDGACHRVLSAIVTVGRFFLLIIEPCMDDWVYC